MSVDKIREQVEYYFSDTNYSRDKFMREVAKKNNNLIPIDTMLTFNRLKSLNATKELIKKAVENSQVVAVEDDSLKKIQTKEYLEYIEDKNVSKRIVVMSGFSIQSTLDEIKEMLYPHCKPLRVSMRRNDQKKFNGTCIVEFRTVEEAEAVMKMNIEIKNDNCSEEAKRQKVEPATVQMLSYEEYLLKKKETDGEEKDKKFIEKVKRDFVGKLYQYETTEELSIADIKKMVKNAAFVDLEKKVIRMKYTEEWESKEFEEDGKKLNITKMATSEAQKYADSLQIKKVPKKK